MDGRILGLHCRCALGVCMQALCWQSLWMCSGLRETAWHWLETCSLQLEICADAAETVRCAACRYIVLACLCLAATVQVYASIVGSPQQIMRLQRRLQASMQLTRWRHIL